MNLTHKYSDTLSNVDQTKLNNGDIVFVSETNQILLKVNNRIIAFGGKPSDSNDDAETDNTSLASIVIEVTEPTTHILENNQLGYDRESNELKLGNGWQTFDKLQKLNNQFDSLEDSVLDSITILTNNFMESLNQLKYVQYNELNEIDLTEFPSHEEVENLTNKLETFNTSLDDGISQITKLKNDSITEIEDFTNDYTHSLNNERYAKFSELHELDLSTFPSAEEVDSLSSKIDNFNENVENSMSQLSNLKDNLLNEVEAFTNDYTQSLNNERYAKFSELHELDLSTFPSAEEVDSLSNKIDNFNENVESSMSQLSNLKDDLLNEVEAFANDYTQSLNNERYAKFSELHELDLTDFPTTEEVSYLNEKLSSIDDTTSNSITNITNTANNKITEINTVIDQYENKLETEHYARFCELNEIETDSLATNDSIALLESKLEDFNNYVELIETTKDNCITEMTNFTNDLANSSYINSNELNELDLSEYESRISLLEAKVAQLEALLNTSNE